jgi:YesN/AraC family two-component response regulator
LPAAPVLANGQKEKKEATSDLPLVLIIEDNPDVVRYLTSCLDQQYNILTAQNGQIGIHTALDMVPDLIISDVMMPEKDGFEVCQILKEDERTSHIPIILLTAKADVSSKLKGLQYGADAYLSKPFHREELDIRIEQLIELRKKLQERFGSLDFEQFNVQRNSPEEAFLLKVRQVVEENMSNSNFGMAQLCRAIGLSRSQLFRKLKALTGKSTSLVVRSIKLQKARHLLKTTDMTVTEIAYETGFSDLAYFSKCFVEEYGENPSAVKNS